MIFFFNEIEYINYDKYILSDNKEFNNYYKQLGIKPESILLLNNYGKFILKNIGQIKNQIDFKNYFITLKTPQILFVGNDSEIMQNTINIFFTVRKTLPNMVLKVYSNKEIKLDKPITEYGIKQVKHFTKGNLFTSMMNSLIFIYPG